MNVHTPVDSIEASFTELREPPANVRDQIGALQDENGGDDHPEFRRKLFQSINTVAEAQEAESCIAKELRYLNRVWLVLTLQLLLTTETRKIVVQSAQRKFRWYYPIGAAFFGIAALAGNVVSVVVTSDYILASAQVLFAGDRFGAICFSLMPFFVSCGVKAWERQIESERLRKWLAVLLFDLGVVVFAAWAVCAAFAFAPDLNTAPISLTGSGHPNLAVALLLSTVIGDVVWSYINLSGAERVLFGKRVTRHIRNRRHLRLTARREEINLSIAKKSASLTRVRGYLARAASMSEVVAQRAKNDVGRAQATWTLKQELAATKARADLLNATDD
jgi:hypothetical protein